MSLIAHHIPAYPSYFDKITGDYLNQQLPSTISNYLPKTQYIQKFLSTLQQTNFNRLELSKILHHQAKSVSNTTHETFQNIQKLTENNTLTLTTGHQLCLFTGPLYVIYKISATIQLSQWFQQHFPEYKFVPIFWMASEDHDINEINHFYYNDQLLQWHQSTNGSPVFSLTTNGLSEVFQSMKNSQFFSTEDLQLFQHAYLQHSNYVDATRFLLNELFGKYGLIVLNPNEKFFKEKIKEIFYQDIFERKIYQNIQPSLKLLNQHHYHIQVNPRTINTFLIFNNKRSLIINENENFKLKDTNQIFTKHELEELLHSQPELFSPNVLLRPIYQQSILPNIAYIGGSAEIAYWLELPHIFNELKVFYPLLIQRPIVFISPPRLTSKLEKLQSSFIEVFENDQTSFTKKIFEKLNINIHFYSEKKYLNSIFDALLQQTENIDKSLIPFINAERTKTLKALDTLEQKLNKSIKQKNDTLLKHIENVYSNLFPNKIMQDRKWNVTYAASILGFENIKQFIDNIMPHLLSNMNKFHFTIIEKQMNTT